jgi:heat shock protein HslJ
MRKFTFTLLALTVSAATIAQAATPALPTGSTWTLTRAGSLKAPTAVERKSAPTLRFDAGRALGQGGCNNFSAPYTLRGNELRVGLTISTKRACLSPVLGVLEDRYLKSLSKVRRYTVSGPVLLLVTSDNQALAFRRSQ